MTSLNFNITSLISVIITSSRDSLGYGLNCPGFESRQWLEIILIYKKRAQTVEGAYLASYLVGTGILCQGVRRSKRDDDHFPSRVEIKNEAVPHPLYIPSYHGQGQIYSYNVRQRDALFFAVALRPNAGHGLLILEVFQITHNNAPQTVGLLWTSDQLVAETST